MILENQYQKFKKTKQNKKIQGSTFYMGHSISLEHKVWHDVKGGYAHFNMHIFHF